jgi:hypothetical protein
MNVKHSRLWWLAVLVMLTSACATRTEETVVVNTIQVGAGPLSDPLAVGKSVDVPTRFVPWSYRITRKSDGSFGGALGSAWASPNVAEMRYCTSLDTPCNLNGTWTQFVERPTVSVIVDWIGARTFWVIAQFRDSGGAIIPIQGAALDQPPKQFGQSSTSLTGVLDERTPLAGLPPQVQTVIAATRTAYPVTGFIKPARFFSGRAGTTVQVTVNLGAASPFGDVNEMRAKESSTNKCSPDAEMSQVAWEPFAAQKSYGVNLPPIPTNTPIDPYNLGFAFYAVSVQYRDAQGNLSEVYCASDRVGIAP